MLAVVTRVCSPISAARTIDLQHSSKVDVEWLELRSLGVFNSRPQAGFRMRISWVVHPHLICSRSGERSVSVVFIDMTKFLRFLRRFLSPRPRIVVWLRPLARIMNVRTKSQ
ncbi:unnamed protein product, partial [Hapterophycus canaliculatus]